MLANVLLAHRDGSRPSSSSSGSPALARAQAAAADLPWTVGFEEAARRAAAARDHDAAEAVRWYREAVRQRPAWDEGWWYIGALSYERGRDADAAKAFRRFVELKPDSGPAWALRGLSDFRLKDYDSALRHLTRGLSLGSVGNVEIRDAVYWAVAPSCGSAPRSSSWRWSRWRGSRRPGATAPGS